MNAVRKYESFYQVTYRYKHNSSVIPIVHMLRYDKHTNEEKSKVNDASHGS